MRAEGEGPADGAPNGSGGGVVEEKMGGGANGVTSTPLELAETAEEQARLRAEAEAKAADMVAAQAARVKVRYVQRMHTHTRPSYTNRTYTHKDIADSPRRRSTRRGGLPHRATRCWSRRRCR